MIIVRIGLGITTLGGSSTSATSSTSKRQQSHEQQSTFQRVRLQFRHSTSATGTEAQSDLDDSLALEMTESGDNIASKPAIEEHVSLIHQRHLSCNREALIWLC